jgi:DtxR family transcriptional regulator, manganese transport regulator
MAVTKSQKGRSRRRASDAVRTADQAALGHKRTRQAHLTETAQDYVEAVADLIEATGEARVVDLAKRLGVTHVTVTQTVSRLRKSGLLRREPYRSIFLTEAGRQMAADARWRHEIVLSFLRAIGVPERVALADAEGIEHHVSPETLAAMQRVTGRK